MKKLVSVKELDIRFSEVDSMGIVWHGNYARYFEDGREAFGREFGLGYMDIFDAGFYAPLVDLHFQFKKTLQYRQKMRIETVYVPSEAAKIIFSYTLFNEKNELVTTGSSVQVFLDRNYNLVLFNPDFYQIWKEKNLQ